MYAFQLFKSDSVGLYLQDFLFIEATFISWIFKQGGDGWAFVSGVKTTLSQQSIK